jgi:DNA processing protein
VDVVYPSENRGLFEEIVNRGGAIISEYGIGVTPEPWHFPARNRIIAGIAQVTLVVETPNNSGALITARHCGEYGRDLFVVPGSVEGGRSRGGHDLVKDGAFLVDEPDEVLAHLGLSGEHSGQGQMVFTPAAPTPKSVMPAATVTAPPAPFTPAPVAPISPAPVNLSPDENAFYAQLTTSPAPFDQIAIAADLPTPRASVAATLLEIKGLISRKPGNLFSLAR